MNAFRTVSALLALSGFTAVSQAGTTVWGFNASFGNPHIQAFDLDTGATIADFVAPNQDANRGRANGRGIAVVGRTIYYSLADTPNVYQTDTITHQDFGIAFKTNLTPGIASLAFDGSNLWLLASQPNDPNIPADDKIYKYSLTGQLLQTLRLPLPVNSNIWRNGLEISPDGIVANEGSVPYDLYDLSGNLKKADLITAPFRTAGIAFDGTNYIVSDVSVQGQGKLAVFDRAGNFLRSVVLDAAIKYAIVDLSAIPTAATAPQFTGIANVGSYASGAIAPGEIVAVFGSGFLAGTRVLFDGIAAPVIATTSGQINLVVPYSVAGKASTQIQIDSQGTLSAAANVPVVASLPGILTDDFSGTGQGAILNSDGITSNSSANPAAPGSFVSIFATGEGQTNPAGVDGKLASGPVLPAPLLAVSATINNVPANVSYAGAAPGLIAGVLQVNVQIPPGTPSGDMPLVLQVGTASSRTGVTVAVLAAP